MYYGVRGAVTVAANEAPAIREAVEELLRTMLWENEIAVDRIVSVFFTVTPDLTALNPARAARETLYDWHSVPMLCSQEPVIDDMLPRCIRVLIQWMPDDSNRPVNVSHVYLRDAVQLRPDLSGLE